MVNPSLESEIKREEGMYFARECAHQQRKKMEADRYWSG
jgi:hypothetical protein